MPILLQYYKSNRSAAKGNPPDSVEDLAVKAEGLFEEDLVFDGPVVGVRREVGQIRHRSLHVVFVPE